MDVAKARRFEKDSVEARDRRMLEFPPSMSHREVAKLLQAEGWFSPKTTVYYIEYRVGVSVKREADLRRLSSLKGRTSVALIYHEDLIRIDE